MRTLILIIGIALTTSILAQEDNPYKYFDDGGISDRKNYVFMDLVYLFNHAYVFGYTREITKTFAVVGGLKFLKEDEIYHLRMSDLLIEEFDFRKSDPNINVFLEASFKFWERKNSFDRFGLGYQFTKYDYGRAQDIYMFKTIFSQIFANRFFFSLNVQFGVRIIKVHDFNHLEWYEELDQSKSHFAPYVHLPLRVGLKF